MRKLLKYLIPFALVAPAAWALTNPASFPPRIFPSQQTHYERHIVNITSAGCSADTGQGQTGVFTAGSCSVKLAAMPYNVFLLRAYQQITTGCNAGTTCTLALGASAGSAGMVAAQSITTTAAATSLTLATPGLIGNGTPPTGSTGGFDIWVTIAQTGTVATAGTVVLVWEFAAPNDGGCVLGATTGTC